MTDFNSKAFDYDKWYKTKLGSFADRVQTRAVFELITPREGMKVLDVGCGTGAFSIKLAEMGCNVTGIDISTNMLSIARKKAEDKELKINFINMDAREMTFDPEAFDIIISMATIEFIDDYKKVFRECLRVLKPSGSLLIGTINKDSKWGEFYEEKTKKVDSVFRSARFKTMEELKNLDPEKLDTYKECLFLPPDIKEEKINWQEEKRLSSINNGGFILFLWKKPKDIQT